MASAENYGYDQPGDTRKVDPVNAGYNQQADPPTYTPKQYGNQRRGPYPMGPPGPNGYYPSHSTNNNNVNVVMSQPAMSTIMVNQRPNDYLGWSIFTLLCCCCPLGIVAVIFSNNARTASDNSNFELARKEASTARIVNIAGFFCGIIIIILIIALYASVISVKRRASYYGY